MSRTLTVMRKLPHSCRIVALTTGCVLGYILLVAESQDGDAAWSQPSDLPSPSEENALYARSRSHLSVFTKWLGDNNARGFIGEVGWPDDRYRDEIGGKNHHSACLNDDQQWNALAEDWFNEADKANLWVSVWSTGEWWTSDEKKTEYPLAVYERKIGKLHVDHPNTQAVVLEKHLKVPGQNLERGIAVSGGEFGAPSNPSKPGPGTDYYFFSNKNPGEYGEDYYYDPPETFQFLASRRLALVRIAFRWERLQPALGAKLNDSELQRLQAVVKAARSATGPNAPNGLKVILDMHNFGAYFSANAKTAPGTPLNIGLGEISSAQFADVWRRISKQFKGDANVYYGLMCEPVDEHTSKTGGVTGASLRWEEASQAALSAIRSNDDKAMVIVSGYNWSHVDTWDQQHKKGWIKDPTNNYIYEAHQYFDSDGSGHYRWCYSEEVQCAKTGKGCGR